LDIFTGPVGSANTLQQIHDYAPTIPASGLFWTDDVEIRRGLGALIVGRDAYRNLFINTGSDSAVVYQRETEIVTISSVWPLAYESGTWTGHLGGAKGPVVIGGSYAAQWVKRGGRWLIRGEVYVALMCAGRGCGYAAAP